MSSPTRTVLNAPEAERVVKEACVRILATGDIVARIKDLKLKGSSEILKVGIISKPLRLWTAITESPAKWTACLSL